MHMWIVLTIGVLVTTETVRGNLALVKEDALLSRNGRAPLLSRYGKRSLQASPHYMTDFNNFDDLIQDGIISIK